MIRFVFIFLLLLKIANTHQSLTQISHTILLCTSAQPQVHTELQAVAVVNSSMFMYSFCKTFECGAPTSFYINRFSTLFFIMVNI